MNRNNRKESGAFAIETLLSLTVFIIAITALLMLSLIIRAQANMQYALNQTAKEISGYFYLLDKLGMAEVFSGEDGDDVEGKIEDLNKSIGHIAEFSSDTKQTGAKISKKVKDGVTPEDVKEFAEIGKDAGKLKKEALQIGADLKAIAQSDNKLEMLKGVLQVFGRALANQGFSYFVAPLVCEALVPKYLTDGKVTEYYEKIGIDPDSVDFHGSELLRDGRSIKIVVTYKLDASKMTLGLFQQDLYFRQVAATAAWICPGKSSHLNSLKQVGDMLADPEEGGENAAEGAA